MTKILLSLFVGKNAAPAHPGTRSKIGKLSGVVGVICNLIVVTLKLTVGFFTGAFSVIADAMNNLSDAASAIVTLVGFKLAEKPADEDHPYGHARYEYLSGLAIAAMIVLIAFELFKTSIGKILHPVAVSYSTLLYVVLVVSVGVKLWMYVFNHKLAALTDSAALEATAIDSRNDSITTGAILLSAAFAAITGWNVDGYVSLALSIFIFVSGIRVAKDTINPLLGENVNPELRKGILDVIEENPKVLGYHDLMIHDYGPGQRFGSLHVEMDCAEDPMMCHEIIDNLERLCKQRHNVQLVIHYDPIVTDDAELNYMRSEVERLLKMKDARIGIHDFRMVVGTGHTNLIFDMVLPAELMANKYSIKDALDKDLDALDEKTYYTVVEFDIGNFN